MTGLQTTIETLQRTASIAAEEILVAALDSPRTNLRDAAFQVILHKKLPEGLREIVRRWRKLDEDSRKSLADNAATMQGSLREIIVGKNDQWKANAFAIALHCHAFRLIPDIVRTLETPEYQQKEAAARVLIRLCEQFTDDFDSGKIQQDQSGKHLQNQIARALEDSIKRFSQHKRQEVLESFLMVAESSNATLRSLLEESREPNIAAAAKLLVKTNFASVPDKTLLKFLGEADIPASVGKIWQSRTDIRFVRKFAAVATASPNPITKKNISRLEHIEWLEGNLEYIRDFTTEEQAAIARIAEISGADRQVALRAIRAVIELGHSEARRIAVECLNDFRQEEANALIIQLMQDQDPIVQAQAIRQLRSRHIPGSLVHLLQAIESPHEIVLRAAQESLTEYNVESYLANFDMMDEEAKRSNARIVRKVDRNLKARLAKELQDNARTRKMRALKVIDYMEVAAELQEQLLELIVDKDQFLRSETVTVLGKCDTIEARELLNQALMDKSQIVREAAEASLQSLARRAKSPPPFVSKVANTTSPIVSEVSR